MSRGGGPVTDGARRRLAAAGFAAEIALVAAVLSILASSLAGTAMASAPTGHAAGCPSHSWGSPPTSHWAPARRVLVPSGALAIRVCRYNGDNAGVIHPVLPWGVLLGQASVTAPAQIASLAGEFNRLVTLPRHHTPIACGDQDLAFLVRIAYPRAGHLTVGIDSCLLVSNGAKSSEAWVDATPHGRTLIAQLESMTPAETRSPSTDPSNRSGAPATAP